VRAVLLDTNAYVAFKRGTPEAVEVLTHVPRIGINSIVLGELLSGFAIGTRAEANRQELQQFLTSERAHQLVIDAETAAQYATVYRELRRRGRPIPTNDMWIAASALPHGFAVISDDKHFMKSPVCMLAHDWQLSVVKRESIAAAESVSSMKIVHLSFLT